MEIQIGRLCKGESIEFFNGQRMKFTNKKNLAMTSKRYTYRYHLQFKNLREGLTVVDTPTFTINDHKDIVKVNTQYFAKHHIIVAYFPQELIEQHIDVQTKIATSMTAPRERQALAAAAAAERGKDG